MDVSTQRVEDSEDEEPAITVIAEKLEGSEKDDTDEDGVSSNFRDDSISADDKNDVENVAQELPAASYGDIEALPAFFPARSLVPENYLRQGQDVLLSPGFRSAAAMAGWDDEALLLAAEEVDPSYNGVRQEDKRAMPEVRSPAFYAKSPQMDIIRETKDKKREERTPQLAVTPVSAGRRHRRARRQAIHECSPEALPIGDLSLKEEFQEAVSQHPKEEVDEVPKAKADQKTVPSTSGHSAAPDEATGQKSACLDQLREELSCAICLDICFEPSTTSCGHSFCKGCMESVLQKCGPRCPKCRQQLKGDTWRSCPVNIVLWNTVQLLFPTEVAVRKEAAAMVAKSVVTRVSEQIRRPASRGRLEPASVRGPTWQHARPPSSGGLRRRGRGRRMVTAFRSQNEDLFTSAERVESEPNAVSLDVVRERQVLADAAFARHLQMQFMSRSGSVNSSHRSSSPPTNLASAAANLRAMANRAVRHRSRH
ncbi:hypothetical protein L7F22_052966 [Adiantum nelumboides]|nr:hypothetical protein [Adiantum nelumboides]